MTVDIPEALKGKKAVDCIGLIVAVYRENGLLSPKNQSFSSLGSTVNAYNKASILKGNIYELGEENLVPGMIVYKYTEESKNNWHIGHAGIYIGNGEVIDATGFKTGLNKTSISDWDAYSWPDGMVLDGQGVRDANAIIFSVQD